MMFVGLILFAVVPAAIVAWLAWCVAEEHRRDRVPILLYHRLIRRADAEAGRVRDDERIWVTYDDRFAEQMRYLAEAGYRTLDLDEYVAIREGRAEPPAKSVVVTFDDGYESNHRLAFPALRAHGLRATIFVAPEPDAYTRDKVRGIDGFLSAEQMRELAEGGVSIQSHTLTHCVLSELSDEEARHELVESRRRISEITGRPVEHIAIPRAGHSRRIRALVQAAGYRTACCNNKGSANGGSDLLALPRIVIERDMSLEDFARALTPRASAALRVVGELKRIPERLGGPAFASRVRRRLYGGPLAGLFDTRTLKRVVAVAGLVYAALGAAYWVALLA